MKVAQVSEYRKRLAEFQRGVAEGHNPLIRDLPGGEDVKDAVTMASLLDGRIRVAARESAGRDPGTVFTDVPPD